MKRSLGRGILVLLLLAAAGAAIGWPQSTPGTARSRLEVGTGVSTEGFARALPGRDFTFPADHGPHLDFQTEWWYFTGNLSGENGRAFGYQLTFFRRGLLPDENRIERPSVWAADDIYMAHLALSDLKSDQFHSFERLQRGTPRLAGARGEPVFEVWLDDWSVRQTATGRYTMEARQANIGLSFTLIENKGPVLQGDGGYSRKGDEPGNASYYYSLTRLQTSGSVAINGEIFPVNGWSWMDHEFSTSALGARQKGWDWFALQLDDGSELMLFTLLREDDQRDPYNSATLIEANGETRVFIADEFSIDSTATWRSPNSGGIYPAGWTIRIPAEEITVRVKPRMADQENRLSFIYWEGAVRVEGERRGQAVSGFGYVELTGYAQSMQGEF